MADRLPTHYDTTDMAIRDASDVLTIVSVLLNSGDVPIEDETRDALGTIVRLGQDRARTALDSLDAMHKEGRR